MNGRGMIPEAWLFDAPLFIDGPQINSMYNAVALPEFEEESRVVSASDIKVSKWTAQGQIEISAADSLLAKMLAPISAKGTASGGRAGERGHTDEEAISLRPVSTPERQLVNLAVHYGANLADRVWSVDGIDDLTWLEDSEFATGLPKALVFIDLGNDCPIVPMAAEVKDGKVVLFYNRIAKAVEDQGGIVGVPPDYPRRPGDDMNRYWEWFQNDAPEIDSSALLMHVVEEAIGDGGRPYWVDYRIPLGAPGSQTRSLHLHMKSRGEYDTGDFAYLMLRRGRRHGIRLVGTLKRGPALNVLAVYEK